jgi:hypothetical protein
VIRRRKPYRLAYRPQPGLPWKVTAFSNRKRRNDAWRDVRRLGWETRAWDIRRLGLEVPQ